MKILSLFDGVSGCQQAFKNLGIEFDGINNQYFASEIDPYAIKITQKNFPNTIQLGDVKKIIPYRLGSQKYIGFQKEDKHYYFNQGNKFDLLVAGFPCQSFSIAGNRKGFEDERGNLFFELLRIINEVKPKYYLLENVDSMSKENKKIICEKLGIDFTLINSSLLTAQNRKRIYFVGKLQKNGTYKKVEIEQPQDKGILLKNILESGEGIEVINQGKQINKTIIKSHCLMARDYKGFGNQPMSAVIDSICVASRGRNIVDGKRQDIRSEDRTKT